MEREWSDGDSNPDPCCARAVSGLWTITPRARASEGRSASLREPIPAGNRSAAARAALHDVKDSNPLDGSFGGSPATVAHVVGRLPRGAVILYLLDARVNLLVHSFSSSRLFYSSRLSISAAGGIRTRTLRG